jgi:hypothetical protein
VVSVAASLRCVEAELSGVVDRAPREPAGDVPGLAGE